MNEYPSLYREQLRKTLDALPVDRIAAAIEWFDEARANRRHIFVCGNGGSAATASHFVCDVVKGASYEREARFRMMALNDSVSTMTAYSNDVNYECVFTEQLKNFAEPGDILLVISGSGNSPNVVKAVEYANSVGCKTIALTGRDGGKLAHIAQLNVQVTEPHMGRIEDAHMIICHMIGYYFMEQSPVPAGASC
jgi:D-sedoheptulose 7-phosphate isomerase